jgi:glycosyltransferase involved in cell wall biosynthesis
MIVKNETRAIRGCLESVKDYIDYWVIVDTGSSDGTQQMIREVLKGVPGDLYERPWLNFEHNRNEALGLGRGRGDYLMIIDADERFVLEEGAQFPVLNRDCYFITVREPKVDYQRIFLIDTTLPWRWEGVLHETLICDGTKTFDLVEGGVLLSNTAEGARSQDPEKYIKDARVLEAELAKDPTNSRHVFYLAQSYCNAQEYALAKEHYERRSRMGGWDEEVFWSLYQMGNMESLLGVPSDQVQARYTKAFQYRPSRVEPLYRMGILALQEGRGLTAYLMAKYGLGIPLPNDHVFVEQWIYQYGLLLLLANTAYDLRFYSEAAATCKTILALADLPGAIRASVEGNLKLLAEMGIK